MSEVEDFVSDLGIRVEPITAPTARRAAQLRGERSSLRLPDALVLACGEEIAADVVLTGHESWGRLSRRVVVVAAR